MKIGVRLESFALPFRKALQQAVSFGVSGVLIDAAGDFSPEQLSQSGRREFRHLLDTRDLELTALNCPLRHGLDEPVNLEPRIEHIKRVMSLAYDMGPRIVTVQAGSLAGNADEPRLIVLQESLSALAAHGDRVGVTLALETGLDSGETMAAFFNRVDTGSLAVNFDPANLFLNGSRPLEDLRVVGDKIVHVQAKDARRHGPNRSAREVPFGHGEIDWMLTTQMLDDMDYRGFVVVVRDEGANRLAEIEEGVVMLRRFVG